MHTLINIHHNNTIIRKKIWSYSQENKSIDLILSNLIPYLHKWGWEEQFENLKDVRIYKWSPRKWMDEKIFPT